VISQALGLGKLGDVAANLDTQLLGLKFSHSDETEAHLMALELAARSAYPPAASVSLWQKMATANRNGGPVFLSIHPSGPNRLCEQFVLFGDQGA